MTRLAEELRTLIALEGPISVERYMALCLGHPVHGYYTTRDPLGAAGDFTTAPEISQMFGELIGLWAAEIWRMMGAPRPVHLVELGPGRGTLMADALRAARALPAFAAAAEVHLVETSPVLRAAQAGRLATGVRRVAWHASFTDVPPGPAIVIANEFFDALPIRQYELTERGWCERLVGLDNAGRLAFGLAAEPTSHIAAVGRPGDVLEWPAAAKALAAELAVRLAGEGGAALVVDYGSAKPCLGSTLQAVKRHAYTDPLGEPGEADLTAHVSFSELARAARDAGAAAHGPVPQARFLRALGIEARAAALARRASPNQAADIEAALTRLTGEGPEAMGTLFKALAITDPQLATPPGFA